MTESTKTQGGDATAKLYCRENDLMHVRKQGDGTIYVVAGEKPFEGWVQIAQQSTAGTTIAHQAGVIPDGMPEAEYWRQQAADSAARALVLKRKLEAAEAKLADVPAWTLDQLQNRAAQFDCILMPMHLTREMVQIISDEEWKWEDLLAAAAAITETQYDAIAAGAPEQNRLAMRSFAIKVGYEIGGWVAAQDPQPDVPAIVDQMIGSLPNVGDESEDVAGDQDRTELLHGLRSEWIEAFTAFRGAFDTPHMRLLIKDDYSADARARLSQFDQNFAAALAADAKQADDVRKLVNAYGNDLLDCAAILHDDARFKSIVTEIRRVVVALRGAGRIGVPAHGSAENADTLLALKEIRAMATEIIQREPTAWKKDTSRIIDLASTLTWIRDRVARIVDAPVSSVNSQEGQ